LKKSIFILFLLVIIESTYAQYPTVSTADIVFQLCNPTYGEQFDTVCAEDPMDYIWHKQVCKSANTLPGTYTFVTPEGSLSNVRNCDSTATLHLTVEACVPEGAIPFYYTIGPGKKVYFSKGNLQYNPNGGTHENIEGDTINGLWRFAATQYEFLGTKCYGNRCPTANMNTWMDLLGWGTSGYNGKEAACCSTNDAKYAPTGTNIAETYYDWGVYNAISNGGNEPDIWRTLTKDEWFWLVQLRDSAFQKCGLAQIKIDYNTSYYGLILLPDEWIWPQGFTKINHPENYYLIYYSNNSFSMSQWQQFEQNGAVFLPAAQFRSGEESMYEYSILGSYWSASSSSQGSAASFVFKEDTDIYPYTAGSPHSGYSVRLVHDVTRLYRK